MAFGFKDPDPACTGFQFLEDLSTAYWHSQVLFTALELNLFSFLDQGMGKITALAQKAGCREKELVRLLRAMERTGLVTCKEEHWYNTQVSSLYLVQGKKEKS